ncbi:hypothetical protein OUZ56_009276 [Daphnia magna]|uniref:Uncharacterized protein n=1 Tax=Daphnia magna TaxID=35525 RepID=A0ABR0AFJ3_9CRUS|nr:hypothetical protein OUZ56_009276 [Daphnia magna]
MFTVNSGLRFLNKRDGLEMRSAIQLDNANSFLMVTSFPPISSNRTRAPAPPFDLAITFQNDTRCPGCNVLNLLSPIQRIEGGKLLNELSQMGTELGKEIQQVLYRCGTLLSSLDSVKQMVGRAVDFLLRLDPKLKGECIGRRNLTACVRIGWTRSEFEVDVAEGKRKETLQEFFNI